MASATWSSAVPSPTVTTPNLLKPCNDGEVFFANVSRCVPCGQLPSGPPPLGMMCNGTGDVYPCTKGEYCPTYGTWLACPRGSICRSGSVAPQACFGGAFTCGNLGMAGCGNVLPAIALTLAALVCLWLLVHASLTLFESYRNVLVRLRFELMSQSIRDYTVVFPFAMRWRRKVLARRKRNWASANQRGANDANVSGRRRTLSHGGDGVGESVNVIVVEESLDDDTLFVADADPAPVDLTARLSVVTAGPFNLAVPSSVVVGLSERSRQSLATKLRRVSVVADSAEAFSDVPRARAFKHALRTVGELPLPSSIELHDVCVAADASHAAHIRADRTHEAKPVVKDVTCVMRAGRFTAIMGPSGCGKSTLLKALAGADEGPQFVSGGIDVNGERRELSRPLPDACFMPQESVLYPDLSGEESIKYARLLSKGPFFTHNDEGCLYDATDELVDEVVDVLGLESVLGRPVGAEDGDDGDHSAVSGGQRRRIVLAMELVKRPSTLLLDEPTTGLDSTSTLLVMRALRDLANNGTSVIAVVHQPGYRVFKMVDDLVLLTAHGTLAYNGPADGVVSYLEGIEYPRPMHASIPEFALDVSVGLARRRGFKYPDGPAVASKILRDRWRELGQEQTVALRMAAQKRLSKLAGRQSVFVRGASLAFAESSQLPADAPKLSHCTDSLREGVWHLRIVAWRSLVQFSRARRIVLVEGVLMVVMALAVKLIFGDFEQFAHAPAQSALGLTLGLTGVVAGLRIFGNDRHIYHRERVAGVRPLPYYVGKIAGHAALFVLNPFVLSISFCLIQSPRGPLAEYFVVCLLTQFAAVSIGIVASLAFPRKIALTVSVLYVLVAFLCNSVTQKQSVLESTIGGFGTFLIRISMLSYAAKALILSEVLRYPPVWLTGVPDVLHNIGFHDVQPASRTFQPTGRYKASMGDAWTELCGDLLVFGCVTMAFGGVLLWASSVESLSPSLLWKRAQSRVSQERRRFSIGSTRVGVA